MITSSTFEFLRDLKENNYRDWFQEHRARYDHAKQEVLETAAELIQKINEFDPSLGFIDPRKAMFRINRDTRFSHNKDPYKTNIGVALKAGGKAHRNAASYYMHIEPGLCFLAGGIYCPEPPTLKALRHFIEDEWNEFQGIIGDSTFQKTFGSISTEGKVLKRIPAGFSIDSPAADYLRLTNYFVHYPLKDQEVCSEGFTSQAAKVFQAAKPLNEFLNQAIKEQ